MTVSPNGLSPIEAAVLVVMLGLDPAGPRGLHRKTATVLVELERHHDYWPRDTFPVVTALAQPWSVNPTLLDPHGNFGSPDGDPPANPRYTEVRLTDVGLRAALAEMEQAPPLPLGLVLGNHHGGGSLPPFSPQGVVAALLGLRERPDIGNAELHELLGPPTYPSGCEVSGPVDGLLRGRPVTLALRARVEEIEPRVLVVTNIPTRPAEELSDRSDPLAVLLGHHQAHYWEEARNESTGAVGQRYVLTIKPGVEMADAVNRLRTLWPLAVEVDADLMVPWRQRATDWLALVDQVDDLAGHLQPLVSP